LPAFLLVFASVGALAVWLVFFEMRFFGGAGLVAKVAPSFCLATAAASLAFAPGGVLGSALVFAFVFAFAFGFGRQADVDSTLQSLIGSLLGGSRRVAAGGWSTTTSTVLTPVPDASNDPCGSDSMRPPRASTRSRSALVLGSSRKLNPAEAIATRR